MYLFGLFFKHFIEVNKSFDRRRINIEDDGVKKVRLEDKKLVPLFLFIKEFIHCPQNPLHSRQQKL